MNQRITRREWLGNAAAGAVAGAIIGCQPASKRGPEISNSGAAPASQPAQIDRAKVAEWTEQIHKASSAESVEVRFSHRLFRNQRFTNQSLAEPVFASTYSVRIRAAIGGKRGEAFADSFDVSAMTDAAKKAADATKLADAVAAPPAIEQQFYPILPTDRFETRRAAAERLAADADALRRIAADAQMPAIGDIGTTVEAVGIGTSYGVTAFERRTEARLEMRVGEGAGQLAIACADRSLDDLGGIEALRSMLPLAAAAKNTAPLPSGEFPVIFSPAATASLARLITRTIADSPDAVNSSVLADRLGAVIVDPRLTLRHRPDHPSLLGCTFDDDGLASDFMPWIENGVLKRLRAGRGRSEGGPTPAPHAWMLSRAEGAGGAGGLGGSLADLIAATPRGIVVLDFSVLATTAGENLPLLAARVGGPALVVDDGKIVGAVSNVSLEETVLDLFNRIDAATQPMPALDVTRTQKWLAPAIRVTDVVCGVG